MYFISAGIFAGKMDNDKMGDGGFSVTAKAVYTPINEEGLLVHLGASASYRLPDANGFDAKFNDDDYNREVTYAAGPEHKFLNAHIGNAGTELKFNAEVIATYGPFLLQGEYYKNKVNRRDNYDLQFEHSRPDMWGWASTAEGFESWYGVQRDIETKGYYAQVGFLLGDEYSYNSASAYLNRPKAGTIEFLARMNNTNLNDIDGIFMQDKFWNADPSKAAAGQTNYSVGGGESTDYSLAVNYYVSNNVMFRLNYTMMDIDNVYFRMDDSVSYLKARLQLNF
jgi:phosphate-selective porin OprO/OprP